MSNDPRTNLDESGLQTGQRPVGHLLGQLDALQEDTQIVSQCVKLKPHFVVTKALAGQLWATKPPLITIGERQLSAQTGP
jgi:hypothetical protein